MATIKKKQQNPGCCFRCEYYLSVQLASFYVNTFEKKVNVKITATCDFDIEIYIIGRKSLPEFKNIKINCGKEFWKIENFQKISKSKIWIAKCKNSVKTKKKALPA